MVFIVLIYLVKLLLLPHLLYSNQLITTIANCSDCPSGYTLVSKNINLKNYKGKMQELEQI